MSRKKSTPIVGQGPGGDQHPASAASGRQRAPERVQAADARLKGTSRGLGRDDPPVE